MEEQTHRSSGGNSFSLDRIVACVQGEEWMGVVTEAVGGVRDGHGGWDDGF